MKKVGRRQFIKSASTVLAAAGVASSFPGSAFAGPFLPGSSVNRFIILGMDGMDPMLVRQFAEEGILPNFAKLLKTNFFTKLQTTMPAQSPVAWSSFINGTNPGGTGIFDFIHRDPAVMAPYLSTSRSHNSDSNLSLGKWSIPLGSGSMELMRKGRPFWSYLDERHIPSVVNQIPGNFPVVESPSKLVSGMGTPDLLGSYGTFTYFSESYVPGSDDFTGGRVVRLRVPEHSVSAKLVGPKNPFRNTGEDTDLDIDFVRDPEQQLVKITAGGHTLLLKKGEWSDWVPLKFSYVSHVMSVAGMVRFYVKDVHPKLKVYCSPINVDPVDPALPIISPPGYGEELAKNIGRFYTQGLPADTKALALNVLDDEEFFAQSKLVLEETMRGLTYGLSQFREGVFFHYFSSIDQNSHMLMRAMDPEHPQYNPNASPEIKNAIRYLYTRMDDALGEALKHVNSRTALIALSDHGFSKFYREFHLNTWMVQQGYTVLNDSVKMEDAQFFECVDWQKTKAYALGFNGIYINRSGREKHGVVSEAEAQAIKDKIMQTLPLVRDEKTGKEVVLGCYDSKQLYSGPFTGLAPDVLVGYQGGYRVSDESVLGKFRREMVGDRTDKWSADHCIDRRVVPGIFLTNRDCKITDPSIWEVAPTILKAFGVEQPGQMEGRVLFS